MIFLVLNLQEMSFVTVDMSYMVMKKEVIKQHSFYKVLWELIPKPMQKGQSLSLCTVLL